MNDTYIILYTFVWEICTPQNYDHIVYWITLKFLVILHLCMDTLQHGQTFIILILLKEVSIW